jgi:hypothetical protein
MPADPQRRGSLLEHAGLLETKISVAVRNLFMGLNARSLFPVVKVGHMDLLLCASWLRQSKAIYYHRG